MMLTITVDEDAPPVKKRKTESAKGDATKTKGDEEDDEEDEEEEDYEEDEEEAGDDGEEDDEE